MPAYDFICKDCNTEITEVMSMAEYDEMKVKIVCPECGSSNVKRRFSPTPHRWKHPDEKKLGRDINDVI